MTGPEILVVVFVVAAYGLGWWARGAMAREHAREQKALNRNHDETPGAAVELLEAVHHEVERAGVTGQMGKLQDFEIALINAVGRERSNGPVEQSARAVRLTLHALRRPPGQERERQLELLAAERAARDAAGRSRCAGSLDYEASPQPLI